MRLVLQKEGGSASGSHGFHTTGVIGNHAHRPPPRRQGNADFELVGYETICEMLAVDGKAPSSRTVMRHLRRHRDIVKPVRIGSHVGYPMEQILKFIARLKGKSTRGEMFL